MIRDKGKAAIAAKDDNPGGQKHSKSDIPEDQLPDKDKQDLPLVYDHFPPNDVVLSITEKFNVYVYIFSNYFSMTMFMDPNIFIHFCFSFTHIHMHIFFQRYW